MRRLICLSGVLLLCACAAQRSADTHKVPEEVTISLSDLQIKNGGEGVAVSGLTTEIPGVTVTQESSHPAGQPVSRIVFTEAWEGRAYLKVNSPVNLNLIHQPEAAALTFDLRVDDVNKAGLQAGIDCGENCHYVVDLWPDAVKWQGAGWQHVSIPIQCFSGKFADFSKVSEPFRLFFYGSGDIAVSGVKVTANEPGNILCPDQDTQSITPAPLRAFWADDWWMKRHQQKLAEKQNIRPEVVLIGDSITHGWEDKGATVWKAYFPDVPTLNLGFGGDRTENVLWRIEQGELDGLSPAITVVMIGTNNTGHRMDPPEHIARGVSHIIDRIKQKMPDSAVLLTGIFPRGENAMSPERINNQKTNGLLAHLAKEKGVHYININDVFLSGDDKLSKDIMPDLLHPNEAGYRLWAQALVPWFSALKKENLDK